MSQTQPGSEGFFKEMVKYLQTYGIPPVLRQRALTTMVSRLVKEDRHFEANELRELIHGLDVEPDAIYTEMVFTAEYYF